MATVARAPAQLTFVGTATTILRIGAFTVLTDPNFLHQGERAYLGYGLTSKRLTEPAMSLADLPSLDAILLSHLHGDHWDRRASAGLDHSLPVITTTRAADQLRRKHGFGSAVGLDTWHTHRLSRGGQGLTVTAVPAAHSTNRLLRRLLPPVMGSVVEHFDASGASQSFYITGDTMLINDLAEIARRYPNLDAMIVHIGGTTLPGGFIVTMTGEMGVECLRRMSPRVAVPVHFDDYGVFKSGLDDFRRAANAAGLAVDVRYVDRGQSVGLT
jgi:L-ascorbate metabolism protein UlaG (beta-lactamase superfamily)